MNHQNISIATTQKHLDEAVFAMNQQRNFLQTKEAIVRKKISDIMTEERTIILNNQVSRSAREEILNKIAAKRKGLQTAERALRAKLDGLIEAELDILR